MISRATGWAKVLRADAGARAGHLALAIGCLALLGWIAGRPWLASWGTGLATMKPITAICVIALGAALARGECRAAARAGWAVAAVAGLSLLQDLTGLELGVERWLAPGRAAPGPGSFTFRMSPATAVALAAAGIALALAGKERLRLHAALLAGLAGLIALVGLLGYAAGVDTLYRLAPFRSLSLPVAVALLAISAGLASRSGVFSDADRPRPLRNYLVILGLAVLTPVILFGAWAAWQVTAAQDATLRSQLQQKARALSQIVDREVQAELETLQALAASPSLAAGDLAAFHAQAKAALSVRQTGAILLYDRNGRQLVNTLRPYGAELPAADPSGAVKRAVASSRIVISDSFVGVVSKRRTFDVVLPVMIDGEVRYAIVRSPQTEALSRLFREYAYPDGWKGSLADGQGIVIARSTRAEEFVGRKVPDADRARGTALVETADLEGIPSLFAYHWSELTGWRTAVWGHRKIVEAPARALWRSLLLTSLLALASMGLAGLVVARMLTQAIAVPAGLVPKLMGGALERPPPTPLVEANRLTDALLDTAERRARAEKGRKEAQRFAQGLVEAAPTLLYIYDLAERRNVYISPQIGPMLGHAPEAVQARGSSLLTELFHPDDLPRIAEHHASIAASGEKGPFEIEYRMRHSDGAWRWLLSRDVVYQRDGDGRPVQILGSAQDVTARKAFEAEREKLVQLVEHSDDFIATAGLDGKVTYMNRAARRMVGLDDDESVEDRRMADFVAPESLDLFVGTTIPAVRTHGLWRGEMQLLNLRTDARISVLRSTFLIRDRATGQPISFATVTRDITERKHAEDALRESEARLASALRAGKLGVHDYDIRSGRIRWDATVHRLWGIPEDEPVTIETFEAGIHPDDRTAMKAAVAAACTHGAVPRYAAEYRVISRSDKAVRWVRADGDVTFEGEIAVRLVGTAQDITERKAAEEALREREAQLRTTFDTAAVGLVHNSRDLRYITVNATYAALVGRTVDQVVGRSLEEVLGPAAFAKIRPDIERVLAGERVEYEAEVRFAGTGPRWIHVVYTPLRNDAGEVVEFVGSIADITGRKRAAQALAVSEERLRLAQDAAGFGAWESDYVTGRPVWSERARKLIGVAPDAPASHELFLSRVHPADQEHVKAAIAQACDPASDNLYRAEYRTTLPDGTERWLEDHGKVELDAGGKPVRGFGMVRDITERVRTAHALRDALADLNRAQAVAKTGSWRLDVRRNELTWSDETYRIFGLPAGSPLTYETFLTCVHPDDRDRVDAAWTATLGGAPYDIEHRIVAGGVTRWVRERAELELDGEGRLTGGFGTAQDITAHKEAEQALLDRDRHLSLVLDAAAAIAYEWDVANDRVRRLHSSEPALPATGDQPDTLEGVASHVHPDDRELFRSNVRRALDRGDYWSEHRVVRPDGATAWLHERGLVERDASGKPLRLLGISFDFTDRKRSEAALRESEARLRMALEASSAGTWSWDGQDSTWDARYHAMYGFGPQDKPGFDAWVGRLHPADRPAVVARVEKMLATPGDDTWEQEFRILHPTEGVRWIHDLGRAQRDGDGKIRLMTGINFDITERKRQELALAVAAERARVAQEAARAMNYEFLPATGEVVRPAAAFQIVTGYQHEEVPAAAHWWRSIIHPDDVERVWATIEKGTTGRTGYALEYRIRHKDGHDVWLLDHGGVIRGGDGSHDRVVGMVFDITEQKAREERIFLLMKEVNHRAKNMLGLVQAIARQTVAANPGDFVRRFGERVQALSANQDLLVRNEWKGVDLHELARAQLAPFADLIDTRLTLAGPPLRLSPAAAQAIGMALHELATNAGKYGALSCDAGRVEVAWRIEAAAAGGAPRLRMSWTEHGGPKVMRPVRRGFGGTVMVTMAKMALGGDVRLEFEESGIRWELACPAEGALEAGGGGIVNEAVVK